MTHSRSGRRLLGSAAIALSVALLAPATAQAQTAASDEVTATLTPAAKSKVARTGRTDAKIVNGTAVNISAAPYTGYLIITNGSTKIGWCTASLVNAQWVLTAAHCVSDGTATGIRPASQFYLVFGKTTVSSITLADMRSVTQVVRHPDYSRTTSINDVAMLKLTTSVTGVTPIPINYDGFVPASNGAVSAYGWGDTSSSGAASDSLRVGALKNVNSTVCGRYDSTEFNAKYQLCATGTSASGTVDTCQGDSGGPLVASVAGVTKLVGVTSGGNGCADPNYPGIYTRVSTVAPWVSAIVGGRPVPASTAEGTFSGTGYRLVSRDGGIFTYGTGTYLGSTGNIRLNRPIVGMARTPSGQGYWLVASDGGIFSFGDAKFLGSTGNIVLNQPIVGMAATPTGRGYWMVARDGGIFTFGDAAYLGSPASLRRTDIIGMAPTPSGQGYLILTAYGSAYDYGDAPGLTVTGTVTSPIASFAWNATASGLWFVLRNGKVVNAGAASFYGDMFNKGLTASIVGFARTPSGNGYWLVSSNGGIFTFGDAKFYGSAGALPLTQPIVAMASM